MNLLMGYANVWSVAPGEAMEFMVSCRGASFYRADIVRLTGPRTGPAGPVFEEAVVEVQANGDYPGREQIIPAGSYIVAEDKAARLSSLESFTLQAFVWPTLPGDGYQALLGTWSEESSSGFSIGISAQGSLELCLGRGRDLITILTTNTAMQARHWYLVAATYDHRSGEAKLYQLPFAGHRFIAHQNVRTKALVDGFAHGPAVFLMGAQHQASKRAGAAWGNLVTSAHYNGKLEGPRLCNRVSLEDEIIELAG